MFDREGSFVVTSWNSGELLEVPLSEANARTRASFEEAGCAPAVPRLAATVMLVRSPREVFMLRRAQSMAFVPDAVVFPGGGVDPRDSDARLPWEGPTPEEWAHRLGVSEETARCVVTAAAREVFEECGVLLAGKDGFSTADLADPSWNEERALLAAHELSFADMLARRGLVLRTDLLGLRSHWLTPVYEPRRYDTYFFAALMPPGQAPDDRTTEANGAGWVDARRILQQGDAGAVRLVPPTVYNLLRLSEASSVEQFAAGVRHADRIMLEPGVDDAGKAVLRCRLP